MFDTEAELTGALQRIRAQWERSGEIPHQATVYIGDSVKVLVLMGMSDQAARREIQTIADCDNCHMVIHAAEVWFATAKLGSDEAVRNDLLAAAGRLDEAPERGEKIRVFVEDAGGTRLFNALISREPNRLHSWTEETQSLRLPRPDFRRYMREPSSLSKR